MELFQGFTSSGVPIEEQTVTIAPIVRGLTEMRLFNAKSPPMKDIRLSNNETALTQAITAVAVVHEHHAEELEITEHPIEQGAAVADHAFRRPAEVTLELVWSNSPALRGGESLSLSDVYESLRQLQVQRAAFKLTTGKHVYPSMLCKSLSVETDAKQENTLAVKMTCREVFFASLTITKLSLPASQTADPAKTGDSKAGGTKSLTPSPSTPVPGRPRGGA